MAIQAIPLVLLLIVRTLNVLYSPIPDCDEVFNYYEPLNFLVRGFGKQTWEYSPEYTIRSWGYLIPYSFVASPLSFLTDLITTIPPSTVFYAIRLLIASTNVYAEYHMFLTLKRHLYQSTANWFLFFTLTSAGMSHASVALLPSSLAMTCTTLATSNFIRYATSTHSTRNALLVSSWFALGGLLGWPFALALAVPSMLYIMFHSYGIPDKLRRYISWSIAISAFYLVIIMEVDRYFYDSTVVVPLNIVLYNVVNASEETGPNIFGTEDLIYYVQNLLLNFNVVALLGYAGIIVGLLLTILKNDRRQGIIFTSGIVAPMTLWSVIFFAQPHKEERFLYPIYTLITTSAATTITFSLKYWRALIRILTQHAGISRLVHHLTVFIIVIAISIISIGRTISLSTNYTAPLDVYAHIPLNATGNVCVGREWYRFPSSFFLPPHVRLQFVESGFRGLLPGEFDEFSKSIPDAVQKIPEGMNNKNQYDAGKVVSLEVCDYMVDINQPVDSEHGEVSFIDDEGVVRSGWKLLYSAKFLNNEKSEGLGRLLYIPERFRELLNTKVVYHDYNLYARTGQDEDDTPVPELEIHSDDLPVETGEINEIVETSGEEETIIEAN